MLNRKSGGDSALVSTFSKAHLKSSGGIFSESRFGNGEAFVIKHFAGSVEYVVEGFLDKNNCSLQEDLMEVLRVSSKPFIREIFQLDEEDVEGGDVQGGGLMAKVKTRIKRMSSGGQHKKPNRLASTNTVSDQFKEQLDILLDSLRQTRTHYVKCIKPNTTKSPGEFDAPLVMQQLQCNGIMELVRIKRQGYPTHSEFMDFYKVFQFLAHGRKWVGPGECTVEQAKEYTSEIAAFALPSSMYQVGHNMIFLRDGFEVMMRDAKIRMLSMLTTRIQSAYRCSRGRRAFLALRRKVLLVQCFQRKRACARRYALVLKHVVAIQKVIRMFLCQKQFKRSVKAATLIQTQTRRFLAQRRLLRFKNSALLMSSLIRMHIQRTTYSRQRAGILTLQCAVRCRLARKRRQARKALMVAQLARQTRDRGMRELRASILILAFFRSIGRCGGRDKARGRVAPPISTKGVVVKSLCARYIKTLRQRTAAAGQQKSS
jgi:myosin heavy subunit